jgi:threonyl-tRNA synthetase
MIHLILSDGSRQEAPPGGSIADAVRAVYPKLASRIVAARLDGRVVDLSHPLPAEGEVELVPKDSPEGLDLLRHSVAHIMADAVVRLFKEVKLAIGPSIENGFYYDFDLPHKLTPEDLGRIEEEMARIVKEDAPFRRSELPKEEALRKAEAEGAVYKAEMIRELESDRVSYYASGTFTDVCRGPHIPSTGVAGSFKLLSVAGAYWRGSERNPMLQRIYGSAFWNEKELKAHLHRLEEAKARDHRVIGKQLGLFHLTDVVGPGLVLWMPKGGIIRMELENWLRQQLLARDYSIVYTPHIGKLGMYRTSGHYPYYQDSQYPPLIERDTLDALAEEGCSCASLCNRMEKGDVDGYLLKPMNCPHHIQIYSAALHSYRDLPVRLAEFGTVYRYEQSGELNGMVRVRGFTQDDAHIFCTPDQLESEIESCVSLTRMVLETLGLMDYSVRVSLRDAESDKYVGSKENWDRAEQNLRNVVQRLGIKSTEAVGEAAFYGPKIDYVVKDCLGREWQLGTIQVDYNLPERFKLEYIGSDNTAHRPVMVHRAPFGALERFVGILIEHYAGAFPLWLAPEQVRVLPIGEDQNEYAQAVRQRLREAGFRAGIAPANEKIGAKIRQATVEKVPYMLVIGGREVENGVVALRHRKAGDQGAMTVEEVVARLAKEVAEKQ